MPHTGKTAGPTRVNREGSSWCLGWGAGPEPRAQSTIRHRGVVSQEPALPRPELSATHPASEETEPTSGSWGGGERKGEMKVHGILSSPPHTHTHTHTHTRVHAHG